jgi:hypothetical protein
MMKHRISLILGLAVACTTPVPAGNNPAGDQTPAQAKAAMVQQMRDSVAAIAKAHGDLPFGFVFTNDPQIGAVIQRNVKIIEQSIPLENLVSERLQALDDVNARIAAAEKRLQRVEDALEPAQARLDALKAEESALEAKIEPMRGIVSAMENLLTVYDRGGDLDTLLAKRSAPEAQAQAPAVTMLELTRTEAPAPEQGFAQVPQAGQPEFSSPGFVQLNPEPERPVVPAKATAAAQRRETPSAPFRQQVLSAATLRGGR